ncbi:C4-dicarboxylate-binding periplasmic protein precursor [Pseudovibrio axinellae]|uniref:C4-dicarboxylate-binding periplasmic protein n=1 Tax=Pseudovibrio axinellae TaxID=989403 RepID=A0A165UMH1_9HYPH|nr:TRAP transporter substrate-binding protein DctP [Pseudovibrio axinellae]KZL12557.1 C4-dicarboxylate-binding periplasmic protein precursor [Pseudovibrio axinellae]SEP67032.1 TRAP-type C4-dicarboxylate transport system, substrate-binding protein [Pseudovibrio axinellae]
MNLHIFSLGVALSLLSFTGDAKAVTELKLATSAPMGTPWIDHMDSIAQQVAIKTDGAIKVKQFHAGQLGSEHVMLQKTIRGRIDLLGTSMTAFSTVVPEMALMGTPFLWESYEQVDCAMDKYLAPVFEPLLEEKGLKLLQWNELGWIHTFGKKPLISPSDVQGVAMRAAPAKYSINFWKGMGANGVVLPLSETASALQTGMVDGGTLAAMTYIATGMTKLAPHLTLSSHLHQSGVFVMSMRTWNKLSEDERDSIESSLVPLQNLRKEVREMTEEMIVSYEETGGEVHRLTPAQRAKWKSAVLPSRNELINSIGGESARTWPKIVEAQRACSH